MRRMCPAGTAMACPSRSRWMTLWAARSSIWTRWKCATACRKYAAEICGPAGQQFKRLGVFGRWDDALLHHGAEYESVVLETFYSFYEQGLVYKGLKSVYWCIHDKTALAEAEVEYEMHTSPSVWVRYPLTSDAGKIDAAWQERRMSRPSSGRPHPGRCLRPWQ